MYRFARLVGAVAAVALSLATSAGAQEYKKDDLVVSKAWARATIPNRPGAAFLTIENKGAGEDSLVGARTSAASRVELHSSSMEGGVMKMRKVEAIPVPSRGIAELKPGGLHIMLFGLARPLTEGERFPITLTFEKAGDIAILAKVKGMTAKSMDHGAHDKGDMKME